MRIVGSSGVGVGVGVGVGTGVGVGVGTGVGVGVGTGVGVSVGVGVGAGGAGSAGVGSGGAGNGTSFGAQPIPSGAQLTPAVAKTPNPTNTKLNTRTAFDLCMTSRFLLFLKVISHVGTLV